LRIRIAVIAAALVAAAVAAAPAPAGDVPPIPGGVKCEHKAKKTYRLKAVLKKGLATTIECDGPARFSTMLNFTANTPQSVDETERFPGSAPPNMSHTRPPGKLFELEEAGSKQVRQHIYPWAAKIMKRYKRTKLYAIAFFEREDGRIFSEPKDVRPFVVVR
jgi:hypothetical protein